MRISIDRVLAKLDEHLGKNDYPAAERHLNYWLSEARALGDDSGAFTVLNELIGVYRKCLQVEKGLDICKQTLALIQSANMEGSIASATAYLNIATAYKAFGTPEKALSLYEKAKRIYEKELASSDTRLAGLYNNMALTLAELARYEDARQMYQTALSIMEKTPNGQLEEAITYLNLAELSEKQFGLEGGEEEINAFLSRAEELLRTPTLPRNGYYAFVAEKCAPSFGYYGYFAFENELTQLAASIRKK